MYFTCYSDNTKFVGRHALLSWYRSQKSQFTPRDAKCATTCASNFLANASNLSLKSLLVSSKKSCVSKLWFLLMLSISSWISSDVLFYMIPPAYAPKSVRVFLALIHWWKIKWFTLLKIYVQNTFWMTTWIFPMHRIEVLRLAVEN